MTSYWKPRWPNTVFFGSYKELNYRIDVGRPAGPRLSVRTDGGPGFDLVLVKTEQGVVPEGHISEKAQSRWLDSDNAMQAASSLLETHFSKIVAGRDRIELHCSPEEEDILPEGAQLTWCMSLVYRLWSSVPENERVKSKKADFLE